jgi:hypothetical protein
VTGGVLAAGLLLGLAWRARGRFNRGARAGLAAAMDDEEEQDRVESRYASVPEDA